MPFLILLLLLIVGATPAEAQRYDPAFRFETIATPHFWIHFHQGGRELAERLAPIAEDVHAALDRAGSGSTTGRTHVVLSGQDDLPNGWATPFPFNVIEIRTVWPEPSSELGNSDDWLRLVFSHEYMHIRHLDRSRGMMAGLRRVFGRAPFVMPNLFLPTWQVEGIAVWQESAVTGGGRVLDGTARRVVEAAARGGRFEPIDRVSGGLVSWPAGGGPYVYGGLFHAYLADRFGDDALERLADRSAAWAPFLGGMAFRRTFGASVSSLWRDFGESVRAASVRVPAASSIAVQVTTDGFETGAPRWDPAEPGTLFYTRLAPDAFPALMRIDAATRQANRVAWRFRGQGLGVEPSRIVFDQLDLTRSVALQSDLYLIDRAPRPGQQSGVAGPVVRLTHGARAGDPDLSRDGRIVCVVTDTDRRALAIMDLGADVPALVPRVSEPGVYFSAPRWSPDGTRIVAERQRAGAVSEVVIVDAATGRVDVLAPEAGVRQATPSWTPDGQYVVLAASDGHDVFNLRAVRVADRRVWTVTSRIEGARAPDVSPDGTQLAFLGYTVRGEDVFVLPFEPATWTELPVGMPRAMAVAKAAGPASPATASAVEPRAYSPLHGFVPRFWSPVLAMDEAVQVGALSQSSDALGRHAWLASVSGRSDTRRADWSASYSYSRWRPSFFVATTGETRQFSDVTESTRRLSAGVVLPFSRVRRSQQLLAAVQLERLRLTPRDEPDLTLDRNAVRFGWALSHARAFGYSISPEEGGAVAVASEHVLPGLGADGRADAVTGQARYYRRLGAPHAVVAMRLAAAASKGDPFLRRRFTVGGSGPAGGMFDIGRDAIALVRGLPAADVLGTRGVVANVEYRVPVWRVERGVAAYPGFLRWVHAAVFVDAGDAWETGDRIRWKTATGMELSADVVVAHGWPLTLTTGVAWVRGLVGDRATSPRAYVRVGRSF